MKQLYTLILLTLFSITANAQNLKLGNPAPAIIVDEWLSNGTDKNGKPISLNNKFIVLEFWATWCGPCIRAIPHINELQSKFGSDSVVFVSISRETHEKIAAFVAKKQMNASVGRDARGISQSNYGVSSIPAAFLINKNGVLIWKGHPATLSEATLKDAIENNNDKKYVATPGEALFNLEIKTSASEFDFKDKKANWNNDKTEVSYTNHTVLEMLYDVLSLPAHRVEVVGAVNQQRYDVNFIYNALSLPGTMKAQAFLLNALMSAFEVRVNETIIEKEVWVVRLPDDFKGDPNVPSSQTGKLNVVAVGNQWVLQSITLNEIASLFENEMGTIVLPYISTNSLRYNIALASGPSRDMEKIKQELATKYGINMYKETRKISATVIQFL